MNNPPETPEIPVYKLPPVFETKLSNGLTVLLVEDRRFPLVTARLTFQAGSKYEPAELAGLSESAANLLVEGTLHRSARQIAEEAAGIGGALSANSSADLMLVAANALAEHLPVFLNLIADCARYAGFPDEEVALRKQNRAQELRAQRADASFLAEERFNKVLFEPHPYSRQDPTPESIARFDADSFAGFRDRHLAPNNAALVVLGALPPRDQVMRTIEAEFGSWERRGVPAPPPAEFPAPKHSIVLVNRPGSVQADIRIGRLAVTRLHPDYFPLLVGNTILGGGTSSRLFANIREKQGWAYDVHSAAQPMKDSGAFTVVTQVRNEVLAEALEGLFTELRQFGDAPVSSDELATAKNYLSGGFVIRLETQDGLASQLSAVHGMGLPLDYLERYTSRVRAVTAEEIREVAKRYAQPEQASIVVVGDAAKLQAQLEAFGPVTVEEAE